MEEWENQLRRYDMKVDNSWRNIIGLLEYECGLVHKLFDPHKVYPKLKGSEETYGVFLSLVGTLWVVPEDMRVIGCLRGPGGPVTPVAVSSQGVVLFHGLDHGEWMGPDTEWCWVPFGT